MSLKEATQAKIKGFNRMVHLIITLSLLALLAFEYVTIVSDDEVRAIDINTPFFKTQFLQSLK